MIVILDVSLVFIDQDIDVRKIHVFLYQRGTIEESSHVFSQFTTEPGFKWQTVALFAPFKDE